MDLLKSLPLGLYLEKPITWLHKLDPRVKLVWLLSCLLTPVLASSLWRLILVVFLILVTLSAGIPWRVWRKQMGGLLSFCFLVFFMSAAIAPDGLSVTYQNRLPANEIAFALEQPPAIKPTEPVSDNQPWNFFRQSTNSKPTIPAWQKTPELPQPTDYKYILFQQGPIKISRKSVDLAIRVSTLFFVVIYSTNLFLLTTASEEITAGIEDLMQPLKRFNLPVTEIALTLTISLRFLPLVLEEIQNLIRSIRTRAINWRKLGLKQAINIWLIVAERLLENLLLRAEQIASAMMVRGFTTPNQHRVEWHELQLKITDWLVLGILIIFWAARWQWGWQ
jgi:energy-coupling factor transport system permease protein